MPLEKDIVLGFCYLSPQDFTARKTAFGAQLAGVSADADTLKAWLATASRQIETHLGGQTFYGKTVTEKHLWKPSQRRFSLNNPGPVTVSACRLWLGATQYETFEVTPVVNDSGGQPIAWGDLLYNRQTNMMEIGVLTKVSLSQPVITITQVQYPFLEITFTTTDVVPEEVAAACGFQAAYLAQQSQVNDLLPAGLTKVTSKDRTVERRPFGQTGNLPGLCEQARSLLSGFERFAVG
jgi:hypothetical protein